jgi:transcription antitermination factor NusA-like protein
MNKKIDCVKMKNDLQERLYKEINPVDFDDYYEKVKEKTKHNKLYTDLKNKLQKKKNEKHSPTTGAGFHA